MFFISHRNCTYLRYKKEAEDSSCGEGQLGAVRTNDSHGLGFVVLETGEHLDILPAFAGEGTQCGVEVGRLRAGVIDVVAQGDIGEQRAGIVDLLYGKAQGLGQAIAVALEDGSAMKSRVVVKEDRARWGHGQRGHSLVAAAHQHAGGVPVRRRVQRKQPSQAVIAAEGEGGGGRAEAEAEQGERRHGGVAPHRAGGS